MFIVKGNAIIALLKDSSSSSRAFHTKDKGRSQGLVSSRITSEEISMLLDITLQHFDFVLMK